MTTGLLSSGSVPFSGGLTAAASASSSTSARFFILRLLSFLSVTKSTAYTNCICGFFLLSMDLFLISKKLMSDSLMPAFFAVMRGRASIGSSISVLIPLSLYFIYKPIDSRMP